MKLARYSTRRDINAAASRAQDRRWSEAKGCPGCGSKTSEHISGCEVSREEREKASITVGVVGFGRCGSTMAMAMLDAGTIPPVLGSNSGSYELPDLERARLLPPSALAGRSIKLLDSINYYRLPKAQEWRFVWLDRDHVEQAKSMAKFARLFTSLAPGAEEALAQSFADDRPKTLGAYERHGPVLVLRYEDVLADPTATAVSLAEFLPGLDISAAAAAVHKRGPECRSDLNVEIGAIS